MKFPAAELSSEELAEMIVVQGVNRLMFYATYLSNYIHIAQKDSKFLQVLQGVRQIMHTGVSLNAEDEAWALANGLPLTVSAVKLTFTCASADLLH